MNSFVRRGTAINSVQVVTESNSSTTTTESGSISDSDKCGLHYEDRGLPPRDEDPIEEAKMSLLIFTWIG